MDFAILGPLRIGGPDGAIELKAAKQRALLAYLLLSHREQAVPSARLIDVLWGEEPPATATKALQVYVFNVRKALGPANPIVTRGSGYAIEIEPEQLDLARFERLVARAGTAPPEEAGALLSEALALFRGAPLADAPLLGPGTGEAERIAELRLAALEQRIEADLALGRHAALVAELEGLVAEHPYRERLHAQLMLALYRSGRQADALDAYRRARAALVDELGLEPGRELQRLEAAVLAQDPELDVDVAALAPVRAPSARATPALPAPPGPLLGRDDDVATAIALLEDPHVRLLTITGAGGIGKTRFALELAHRLDPHFPDGARLVALGGFTDPARVRSELEQALGGTERLAMLAVVDNFEHLLAAAGDLSGVLAASPDAKLVVTSRAPLRLAAEHELALGPLAAEPAAALFERRARAVDPRLALEPGDDRRIDDICARLDGLPLAIELAAARIKVLSPAEILDRLSRRLDLLSAGSRDAPVRQQTLRAAIGWSYDLLDAEAQRLFAQLSVFVGGFTLEAAEAVCGPEALDGIAALADQSLVTRDGRRFGMLETVREYALERLVQRGELTAVRHRHARAYAALLEGADEGLISADVSLWAERLNADHDNLRAAIRHATAAGEAVTALSLIVSAARYWATRGNVAEGRELAEAALALTGGPPELRIHAVDHAGVLAAEQGDYPAAREHFEVALELARAVGARERIAAGVNHVANIAIYEGDYQAAIRGYEESAAIARELGDARAVSLASQNLGIAHSIAGHPERAIEAIEESLVLARGVADPSHITSIQRTLARLILELDPERALVLLRTSLESSRAHADRNAIAEALETAAAAAANAGDAAVGAQLWGAAEALRAKSGASRWPDEEVWASRAEDSLRAVLGADGFAAEVAAGDALTMDESVALALAIGSPTGR